MIAAGLKAPKDYTASERPSRFRLRKPIRVMHVLDKLGVRGSSIHGVTQVLAQSIPRFDSAQFEFTVCSLRCPEPAGDVLRRAGVPIHFLSKRKYDLTTLVSLLRLVKRERPSILHLHGFGAGNFGRVVSLMMGLPNVVHEHAILRGQPLYQTVAETLLSPLTTRAIAVSEPVRDYMEQCRKIKPHKLETVICGLATAEFNPPTPDELLAERERLNILPGDQVVCTVGRLDLEKGQRYLLQAAKWVLERLPRTRFLLVGDGPDRHMLETLARNGGVAQNVRFTGFRADVCTLMGLSDVIAIPSLSEGGPITLFEAMNLRKPVVGTPVGLMSDVIKDGETGFLVPCRDTIRLADRLIAILKNPQLARTIGDKGWEKCQQYDISRYVARVEEIYRELVDERPLRRGEA